MHERSLVKALLGQVETLMAEHAVQRVAQVNVSIGEFAGVERDLFEIAFEDMVAETGARGARLEVQSVPLAVCCGACQQTSDVTGFKFQCRHCGSREVTVVRGEELMLDSVVMEQADHER